jgi:hypothetical protein
MLKTTARTALLMAVEGQFETKTLGQLANTSIAGPGVTLIRVERSLGSSAGRLAI